jgi:hypothetical protein
MVGVSNGMGSGKCPSRKRQCTHADLARSLRDLHGATASFSVAAACVDHARNTLTTTKLPNVVCDPSAAVPRSVGAHTCGSTVTFGTGQRGS